MPTRLFILGSSKNSHLQYTCHSELFLSRMYKTNMHYTIIMGIQNVWRSRRTPVTELVTILATPEVNERFTCAKHQSYSITGCKIVTPIHAE